MRFINREHEDFYNNHAEIASRGQDFEALIYTLGIDSECRNHFSDLYDPKNRLIKVDGLYKGWQTGASVRIARLAFHLFTWQVPGEPGEENANDYLIKSLFSNLDTSHREGALLALQYFA